MAVINPSWYVANETRDYPVADQADCLSRDGLRLPQNIIADLRISYPNRLGLYPFISAVTVTPYAVTVLLQASQLDDNSTGSFVALAAITLLRGDITPYRQYPLKALYPGVAGTIVFGQGVNTPFTGHFMSPTHTCLTPRSFRPYMELPIGSMSKINSATELTGLVLLKGESPVTVMRERRDLDSKAQDVVVIRLVDDPTADQSAFQTYAGPCAGRPESSTCGDPQPIEFINGVGPDCDGFVDIEFKGCATVGRVVNDSIVVIDCGLGLTEACLPPRLPDDNGLLPSEIPHASRMFVPRYSPIVAHQLDTPDNNEPLVDEIVVLVDTSKR